MTGIERYASRLSPEDRAALMAGHVCTPRDPAPPRRRQPPAPPHSYRPCVLWTPDGRFVRCRVDRCQDEQHRVRSMLS